MTATVQPVIMTADLNRLLAFYTELLGATQTSRVPGEGPPFYVGLQVGDSELGLVADAEGAAALPARQPLGRLTLGRFPALKLAS